MLNLIQDGLNRLRNKIDSLCLQKTLVFLLILATFFSLIAFKITLPAAQDLPRQMKNGEMVLKGEFEVLTKNVYSALEPEQPFANHHWLYGVFAYLLHAVVGWGGLVVFKVIFLLGVLALLFYTAAQKTNFWIAALCIAPTMFLLSGRMALRPEIFSYAFVVVYLFVLMDLEAKPERKWIYGLIPIQLVWVNTHLFFPVGIMLVGGYLFEKILLLRRQAFKSELVGKLTVVLLSLGLVTFMNPYGLFGVIFSLRVNTDNDFPISSAEINSIFNVLKAEPGWGSLSSAMYLPSAIVLAVSFILVLLLRWRRKHELFARNYLFFLVASLGSAGLAAYVIRGLPLFALVFFIAISINLNEIFAAIQSFVRLRWPTVDKAFMAVRGLAFGVMFVVLIWFGQNTMLKYTEMGFGLARWSTASAEFYDHQGLTGPVFNDTDIGSYLIYNLYPEEKIFADNRFGDAYSAEFFSEVYLPLFRDEEAWTKGLETYGFNTIFFYHYDAVDGARDFLYRRIYDPEWAWIYVDSYAVILVRNTPENQDVISQFQITSDNIYAKLEHLLESPIIGDRLAGADILNLIGRLDLSTQEYLRIVLSAPDRGKIWMVLGRTELTRADYENSNPGIAAVYLERAIEEGWKTWESYSYLALAYYRMGDLDRAEEAAAKELRIDPHNPDAQEWQQVLAEARALELLQ